MSSNSGCNSTCTRVNPGSLSDNIVNDTIKINSDITRLQKRASEISHIIETTTMAIKEHPLRPDTRLYEAHMIEMAFYLERVNAKVSVCQGMLEDILRQAFDMPEAATPY